ncbi:MAG: protoporphyrinogen oxidase HemJ [Hyphomicrobiales bacterium]|nr:protoporphyrinogen oxidase HemJ [Hyphomicrobiales bacterium]
MWDNYYLWLKALHIIAVISWMAGMLYLPRLFVYHTQVEKGSEASEMLKVMERRLLRYIINPAMIMSFIIGILLIIETKLGAPGGAKWIHVKIGLLLLMVTVHGILARHRKQFVRDANIHSARYYRILNEIPTVLMIFIVILAVLKPF